jgi:peptidyl-prolyl cis-trans isomerase B (cyclophilin B)
VVRALVVIASCAACAPTAKPPAAARDDDVAARVRVANAEAAGDVDALGGRSRLELRALGRIAGTGNARARQRLLALAGDADPQLAAWAAGALGVAFAMQESPKATAPLPDRDAAAGALLALLARAGIDRAEVLEAIGRVGGDGTQAALAAAVNGGEAEVALIALARYARRGESLEPAARAAIIAAWNARDPAIRAAAMWAFAREHITDAVTTAAALVPVIERIRRALHDPDARVRAAAAAALGKHRQDGDRELARALSDLDWHVAAEAVRAMASAAEVDDGNLARVVQFAVDFAAVHPPYAHVALEALRALRPFGATVQLRPQLDAVLQDPHLSQLPPIVRGWIVCLTRQDLQYAAAQPDFAAIAACSEDLPEVYRAQLVAETLGGGHGDPAIRDRVFAQLRAHRDPRVRAATLEVADTLWPGGDAAAHTALMMTAAHALAASDPGEASAAIEAAARLDALAAPEPLLADARAQLDAAIAARAARETEPELADDLADLIVARELPSVTRPTRAHRAPPVHVEDVIGHAVTWHVDTTRGRIDIALSPDVAPWAVAAIVALTRTGFYDGLDFHRVVPDFVVQGGDPTMSGAGGPGFLLPAEPSTHADGAQLATGGVGIADSGPGTGGSQWFVMQAAAPHLDGRYTWFGVVAAGQDVADALVVGDRIVKATVEMR